MKCTADSIVEIQENIEQYHTDLQRRQAERDALQKTADTLNKTVIYYKAELKRLASLDESMKKCSNYMTCTAGAGKVGLYACSNEDARFELTLTLLIYIQGALQ